MLDTLQSAGAVNPVLNGPRYRGSRFDDVDVSAMAAIGLGRYGDAPLIIDKVCLGGESSVFISYILPLVR